MPAHPSSSSQFARFAAVGAAGFVVDVATLYAAIHFFGLAPIPARLPAFLAAVTFTWAANRHWTFTANRGSRLAEWGRFVVANSAGLGVNALAFAIMLRMLPDTLLTPMIAAGVGSTAGLLVNFVGSRRFVFAERR